MACGGDGATAADAPVYSGCRTCATSADCGGLECLGHSCLRRCHGGGECPSAPGAPVAECSTTAGPDDAAPGSAFCVGGCPP